MSRCSMGATMGGPWRCGSFICDKGEDCGARLANEREAVALSAALIWLDRPEQKWTSAWLISVGRSPLGLVDTPMADSRDLSRKLLYG